MFSIPQYYQERWPQMYQFANTKGSIWPKVDITSWWENCFSNSSIRCFPTLASCWCTSPRMTLQSKLFTSSQCPGKAINFIATMWNTPTTMRSSTCLITSKSEKVCTTRLVRYVMQWTPTLHGACLVISCTITPNFVPQNVETPFVPNIIRPSLIFYADRPPNARETLTMIAVRLFHIPPSTTLSRARNIEMRFQTLTMKLWILVHDWQSIDVTSSQYNVRKIGTLHHLFCFLQHHTLYSLYHLTPNISTLMVVWIAL